MVRVGKAIYGIHPSIALQKDPVVTQAITWKSQIAQIKTLKKDFPVGYGADTKVKQDTKIAIIPQGYSDGYDKRYSYEGEVLVEGTRCKILGKVSMNMMVIDVTNLNNVNVGQEVVLLGNQQDEIITIKELSQKSASSECEVISRVSNLLNRRIIND